MMRQLFCGCVVLALSGAAVAADDLQPAVNTSAPAAPAAPAVRAPAASAAAASAPAKAVPPPAPADGSANSAPSAAAPIAAANAGSSGARSGGGARDRVELENTQITGNRELPKVMYVVPWKKPDLGDFGGRPAQSLLDELLAPVDRDVFKRQNRYFEALQPDAAAPRSGDEK